MPRLRIIFETEPQSGSRNMAIDEALLENSLITGDAVLRWYRWSEPTLSLGYFQNSADLDPAHATLPLVRRLSGGGAILHHHEWTYSCTLPPAHPLTGNPHDLYLLIHETIIGTLSRYDLQTALRGTTNPKSPATGDKPDPFLCFQRGDPCDILCGRHKILGSAQRRRRGAVLQHGSLILRTSPFAPHIPGLFDLSGISPDDLDLARTLCATVAENLLYPPQIDELSPAELDLTQQLYLSRYSEKIDWNRQSPGHPPLS